MKQNKPVLVVSAIIEKEQKGEKYVFIQTRYKPKVSPLYTGLLEIPAGIVESFEDVYSALKREVLEETGLRLISIVGEKNKKISEIQVNEKNLLFQPFICSQTLLTKGGLPWINLIFLCQAEGRIKMDKAEAKNPRWLSLSELEKIIEKQPEKIFPLQLLALKHYLKKYKPIRN